MPCDDLLDDHSLEVGTLLFNPQLKLPLGLPSINTNTLLDTIEGCSSFEFGILTRKLMNARIVRFQYNGSTCSRPRAVRADAFVPPFASAVLGTSS